MKKATVSIVLLLLLTTCPLVGICQPILLSLPVKVVEEVVQKSLPLQINQPSDSLAGVISVDKIDNLIFKDKSLSASVSMSGRDVQLNTQIGGHQIRLNVGNVMLDFNLDAVMRFDPSTQTLFLRPSVSSLNQQGAENSEAGELMVALFNDQEFPVALDNLQPFITDIGNRQLIIDMSVEDIRLDPESLDLLLTPQTSVKNK